MFRKGKAIISLILIICLTVNLSTMNVVWGASTSIEIDGLIIEDNVVTHYYGNATKVVIPDGVTSIADSAFDGCDIETIVAPDSVTSIGDNAFTNCGKLENLTFPKVTSIGNKAFDGCTKLKNCSFPAVTSIGEAGFAECVNLINIELPVTTNIGDSAFLNCTELINMNLPETIAIGENAFRACTSLSTIKLPKLKSIGKYAFYQCGALRDIAMPNVESIGDYAFNVCDSLESITIPDSTTSIGDYVFYYCHGLKSITFPNAPMSLGQGMFMYCNNLIDVKLPQVTSLGDSMFLGCSSLERITIPNSVTNIGSEAFLACSNLSGVEIPDSVTNFATGIGFNTSNCIIYGNAGSSAETYSNATPISFWIISSSIDTPRISVATSDAPIYCDGTEQKPAITVKNGNVLLKQDTDYTVEYADNVNAGKASVTIRGKKYYSGSITKQFDIEKQTIGALSIALSATTFTYDGNAKEPVVTVRSGGSTLKPEIDYTVSYKNNVEEGTADVIITGTGTNYTGSVTEHFTITKTDKTVDPKEPIVTITKKAESIQLNQRALYLTKDKKIAIHATIAPADTTNQALTWTSSNNSVATVDASGIVTAIKNGTVVITATTTDGSLKSAQCSVTVGYAVTYKCNGGTNVEQNPGAVTGTTKVKLKNPTRSGYAFAGWYTDKKLTKGVSSLAKGTKSGVTLYAKWDKVKVAKANVRDLKSTKKKKLTVSYDKVDGAKGYELVYSTDKKLTKNTTTITTGKTSTTIAGLANGKKYYVKVRAYKIDSMGNKVYGKYSGVMSVKVMK